MKRAPYIALGALAALTLALLMGPTSGFPSRPTFQEVTIRSLTNARQTWRDQSQGANERAWACGAEGLFFKCYTRTDAGAVGDTWLTVERSITDIFDTTIAAQNELHLTGGDGVIVNAAASRLFIDDSDAGGIARSAAWYVEDIWTDATVTGCTTNPAPDPHYTRVGQLVTLTIPVFSCTSNATTFTLTGAPTIVRPIVAASAVCSLYSSTNNGANETSVAGASMSTAGTLTLYRSGSTTGWTNTGSKGFPLAVYCAYTLRN